ncbi:hypothetical protein EMPS_06064 [Entomortierella parvispora]|uniref:Uncharacterized protein n=1 Tax=Entomortierella parvispora TaxID=205924 RepID=A0A9P3LWW2_9FUNG|nr:hypothetical protein EMPS_06064 [Entomortierella parvispora]
MTFSFNIVARPGTDPPQSFTELVKSRRSSWSLPPSDFRLRLENAAKDIRLQSCREQTEKALLALRSCGLRVDVNPADPNNSLAHFIIQHFLRPGGKYDLHLTVNSTNSTMIVPTRTQLLLVYLADRLNCNIFLFSCRGAPSPRTEASSPPSVCGIFHRVDSYLKFSEFLALAPVDTVDLLEELAVAPASELALPQPIEEMSSSNAVILPTNMATFRANKRLRIKRSGADDTRKAELLEFLEMSCIEHLKKKIDDHICESIKKEDHEGKEEFKTRLSNLKSLPRGPLSDAAALYIEQRNQFLTRMQVVSDITAATSNNNLRVWCEVVQRQFDEIWTNSEQSLADNQLQAEKGKKRKECGPDEGREPEPNTADDDENTEEWRTCTVTMKQALHPGLSNHEDFSRIISLLQEAQDHLTDVEQSLYLLAQVGTILIAGGVFSGQQGTLCLGDILPSECIIPPEQRILNVAPIVALQSDIENKNSSLHSDIRNVLSQNHLSQLYTQFKKDPIARRKTWLEKESGNHTKWLELAKTIDSKVPGLIAPHKDRYSKVVEAHTRQCATAISNLWEGKIYEKALDYLLRYLLSAWLAPDRMAAHKERKSSAVKKKNEQKATKDSSSDKPSRSHWRHSMSKLLNKVAKYYSSGRTDQLHHSIAPLKALYDTKPPEADKESKKSFQRISEAGLSASDVDLAYDENMEDVFSEEDSSDDDLDMCLLESQAFADELDTEWVMDVDDASQSSPITLNSDLKEKEPSRKTLRRLQTVVRTLLESPLPTPTFSMDHIKDSLYKGTSFTERQLLVAQKIINFLRPYVPRRWRDAEDEDYRHHTPHIVLRAPIVLISNAVLRLLGQTEFTRRLSPSISSGKIHGLQLGAGHLYQVLSGESAGRYDLHGATGIMTNVADCTASFNAKRVVFANIFDIEKIEGICKRHGFTFGMRMTFVDQYTLNLSGPQTTKSDTRHPVHSAFEESKKAGSGLKNGRNAHWRKEFESRGMSKDDVEHQVELATKQVELTAKEREGPRKELAALRKECNALNSGIRAIPWTISNNESNITLKKQQMSELKAQQAILRIKERRFSQLDMAWDRAKKELYYWNRLLAIAKRKAPKDNPKKKLKARKTDPSHTSPSWEWPQAEDIPQQLDLKPIFDQHLKPLPGSKRIQVVAICSEDPGVRVMSENVFLTVEGIEKSMNRFQVLADLDTTEELFLPTEHAAPEEHYSKQEGEQVDITTEPWTKERRNQAKKATREMKLPKAHRITARQVEDISFGRKLRRKRERLLETDKHKQAKADLEKLSDPDASLATASTIESVQIAIKIRDSVAENNSLRELNRDRDLVKIRRTCRHRTKRAWAKVASNLRAKSAEYTINKLAEDKRGEPSVDTASGYCSNCCCIEISKSSIAAPYKHPTHCVKTTPVVRHVIFMGAAGTGVGSRIGGHYRLGGKNIRKQHRQVGTVVVTDEYMSTQRCCFCLEKTHSARSRRIVGSEKGRTINTVTVNGSKVCFNTACPAYKNGYTTRPRDTQACVCIGISGYSAIKDDDRIPLAPFRPYLVPEKKFDQHQPASGPHQTRSTIRGGSSATPRTRGIVLS